MKARLSDQADIIANGQVPMPMYTCLHVKSNVSAKVFQEWYEFTPYEVGIPKYGLFFKTSDFASKFYMGEKIKSFPEVRLHYLYGIWGSAFTILFKRLHQERSRNGQKEIVKMILQTPSSNNKEEETLIERYLIMKIIFQYQIITTSSVCILWKKTFYCIEARPPSCHMEVLHLAGA